MADRLENFTRRTGESISREFIRSGRFFHLHGNWFFKTREGFNYGPYDNKTECKYAYAEFLDVVANQNELGSIPDQFEDTSTDWKVPNIKFS